MNCLIDRDQEKLSEITLLIFFLIVLSGSIQQLSILSSSPYYYPTHLMKAADQVLATC